MLLITKTDLVLQVVHGVALLTLGGVVLLTLGANGWRPYKIIIVNHTVETYSPKCRMNASFFNTGVFHLYVEFLNGIRNPYVHTGLFFESDAGKYDMELVNRTIDLCKFYKNKKYEPIIQVVFKLFGDYLTHWFKSCPLKKGLYYIKDVELNVEKLPPFFPEKNGMFDSVVMDKRERLYRINVYFQILKTFKQKIKP